MTSEAGGVTGKIHGLRGRFTTFPNIIEGPQITFLEKDKALLFFYELFCSAF